MVEGAGGRGLFYLKEIHLTECTEDGVSSVQVPPSQAYNVIVML